MSRLKFRFIATVLAALGWVGSASAGFITMSQYVNGQEVLDGETISITAGDSLSINLAALFTQSSDYYNQYTPRYYFPGYGGYINVTGYGVASYNGWRGSMTFFSALDYHDPYSELFNIYDTAGNATNLTNDTFQYLNAGLFKVTLQATYLYDYRSYYQGCGGSAWAQWNGLSAWAWCTNPYSSDAIYYSNQSAARSFFVNVVEAPADTVAPTDTIPEPTTIALLGLGLAGLGISRWKAKKQ